jgi:hypothetical protein
MPKIVVRGSGKDVLDLINRTDAEISVYFPARDQHEVMNIVQYAMSKGLIVEIVPDERKEAKRTQAPIEHKINTPPPNKNNIIDSTIQRTQTIQASYKDSPPNKDNITNNTTLSPPNKDAVINNNIDKNNVTNNVIDRNNVTIVSIDKKNVNIDKKNTVLAEKKLNEPNGDEEIPLEKLIREAEKSFSRKIIQVEEEEKTPMVAS